MRRIMQHEQSVEVPSPRGPVRGLLATAPNATGGVILCAGAGGGVLGPSGVYAGLAERLQVAGITALRLDYRQPNHLGDCVADVLAGVVALEAMGASRVALIGWSFGGAVAINAGAVVAAVVGVATIASQTSGTDAVAMLAPRHLLLLHGTDDQVLSPASSRDL
jgi:hypothetical protein